MQNYAILNSASQTAEQAVGAMCSINFQVFMSRPARIGLSRQHSWRIGDMRVKLTGKQIRPAKHLMVLGLSGFLAACTSHGSAPSLKQQAAAWLGEQQRTLALTATRQLPAPRVETVDPRHLEGAGKGASKGFLQGLDMASKNPDPSVAFWGALIVAPTMALGGALIGAATGDPKRTMYDIDKIAGAPELFSTVSGTNSFRNRLLDQLVEHSGQIGHSLQSFPAVAAVWPSPIPEKIEGMIAVNIREFGLTNQVDNPHDVALLVKGTLTIYQRDRFGTFWGEWSYVSDHRSIANWSANDAELFRKEIDKAAGVAAGRIANCLRPQYSDTLDGERDEPASQGGMPDC